MNFAGIPDEFATRENSKIWLQSIPYDGTSSWGKGADEGFGAFMEAAENMELYDIETDSEVYRHGIYTGEEWVGFKSPEEMFQEVYQRTKELLATNKFLTFFGGEHSISIGVMKAFYEAYKEDVSFLQIDAHADLRSEYEGTRYNHACAVYDVNQNSHLVQVGIRSMDIEETKVMHKDRVFFAHELDEENRWMEQVLATLNNKVYITLDLDAFDSSIMPSTGTPEPGGMSWDQVTGLLKRVFQEAQVLGFDIVELAPLPGLKAPNYLAAKLYYKMLSYQFAYHKNS